MIENIEKYVEEKAREFVPLFEKGVCQYFYNTDQAIRCIEAFITQIVNDVKGRKA